MFQPRAWSEDNRVAVDARARQKTHVKLGFESTLWSGAINRVFIISEYRRSPLMIWEYHGAGWDRDGGGEGCHRWLYSLGSTQPWVWVSSDVKSMLMDFEIAIFSSPGIEHGLSRCWTTWRAQRAPWARQLNASSSLLMNYSLLNPRSWWVLRMAMQLKWCKICVSDARTFAHGWHCQPSQEWCSHVKVWSISILF